MFGKKEVILIPHWIQESLARKNLPLSACLNFEQMRSHLSLNDLVGFLVLQKAWMEVAGYEYYSALYQHWLDSIANDRAELRDYLSQTIKPLEGDASFEKDIETRLFTEDTLAQYKQPFIIYDTLASSVMGAVLYPGFFVADRNDELQKDFIEAILKVLYVYDASHEVAQTPLFKRYLELLAPR